MATRMLTVAETAERYRVQVGTVYQWVHHRRIPFIKPTQQILLFSEADLDKWDERNTTPVARRRRL